MQLRRLALLCVAATCLDRSAAAQGTPAIAPYSVLNVRVSVLAPLSIGTLAPYYVADAGGIIEASTPFNVGEVGVAVGWMPFTRRRLREATAGNANENFRAYLIGVGWETPAISMGRLQAAASVRASTFRMAFNDTIVNPGIRTEDELQLGVSARVLLPVTDRLRITGSVSHSHVFLHIPLRLTTASAGVEWKFALPDRVGGWFR